MRKKKDRQRTILSLIQAEAIGSQGALAHRLFEMGFNTTQASVSRDLDELGVEKVDGRYTPPVVVSSPPDFGAVDFETAGDCLIVGHCASGLASAITVRIDSAGIHEIVGTIAGDDTIFIAVKDAAAQSIALEKIIGVTGK